jgi:hypothetical protein
MSTFTNAVMLLVGLPVPSAQVCNNMREAVKGMSLPSVLQDPMLAATEQVSTPIDARSNSPTNPVARATPSLLFRSPRCKGCTDVL